MFNDSESCFARTHDYKLNSNALSALVDAAHHAIQSCVMQWQSFHLYS